MRIAEITTPELVDLDVSWSSKDEAISKLIDALVADGAVTDGESYKASVMERESVGPTGMQDGLAIPHGKDAGVRAARVAMARLTAPIADWESVVPGNEVDLVFLLAIPEAEAGSTHLKVLQALSKRFLDSDARAAFMAAKTEEEFIAALERPSEDEESSGEGAAVAGAGAGAAASGESHTPMVLAITACATGIAHTYMAAEALEKGARELGVEIHVEKQGASGIEDRHTIEQIRDADSVIFAVDVPVKQRERYAGKQFLQTKVAEPLRRAPEMIMESLERPEGTVTEIASDTPYEGEEEEHSLVSEMTSAVLSGIGYMIPVIVAAGITMGIAKLTWQYGLGLDVSEMGSIPPEEWTGFEEFLIRLDQFGALVFRFMYPVFALFTAMAIADRMAVVAGLMGGVFAAGLHFSLWGIDAIASGFLGALIMGLGAGYLARFLNEKIKVSRHLAAIKPMLLIPGISVLVLFIANYYVLDPFFGWLNQGIYDAIAAMPTSQTLALSAVIAACTAFDLGGPVNKAAGAVAIGLAADGVFPLTPRVLAIVIPPMGMGLAVIIDSYVTKRELFDPEERVVGQTSFLLSFLGISEGAIPFMLRNPALVIPINVIGAVIGACTAVYLGAVQWLPLPAIWGWPLVEENLWAYLLGMFLGAVVIAILYTAVRVKLKRDHATHIAERHAEHEAQQEVVGATA